jgi:hypothetical protein
MQYNQLYAVEGEQNNALYAFEEDESGLLPQ